MATLPPGMGEDRGPRPTIGARQTQSSFGQLLPPPQAAVPNVLELLKSDKLLHMSISANLTLGSVALTRRWGVPRRWALLIGFGTALAAGVAKELWDFAGNGQAEWADLAADLIGTAAGVTVSLMFVEP